MASSSASFAAMKYAAASKPAWPRKAAGLRQPTLQVGREIGDRLEAHRDPHQPVGDAGGGARLGRDAAVRGRRRVRDGGLHVAEVGGDGNEAGGIDELPGGAA